MSCSADYSFVFWSGNADYYFELKSPPSTVYQLQCHTFFWYCGGCHTFYLFCLFQYMHSESQTYNDTVHYSHPFAEASLHFLIAFVLLEINLHGVPSRDMNSGLPATELRSP